MNEYYTPQNRQEANIQSGRVMQVINYYCDMKKEIPNFRSLCIIIKASTLEKNVVEIYQTIKGFEENKNYLMTSAVKRGSFTRGVKQTLEEIR